jgi:hypothetical protein
MRTWLFAVGNLLVGPPRKASTVATSAGSTRALVRDVDRGQDPAWPGLGEGRSSSKDMVSVFWRRALLPWRGEWHVWVLWRRIAPDGEMDHAALHRSRKTHLCCKVSLSRDRLRPIRPPRRHVPKSICGTVRPSVLAVLRLMTISKSEGMMGRVKAGCGSSARPV